MGLAAHSWSSYVGHALDIHRQAGLAGLCSRALHKLAAPAVDWGGVTFFVRDLRSSAESFDVPPGIEVRQATPSDIRELNAGGDPSQDVDELVERMRRGDRAYAALTASGQPAHLRWVATGVCHIPEIDCDIVLAPRQAYLYNCHTHPAMRRRGIDSAVRQFLFQTLAREGYEEVFSYARRDNAIGLRAAARWQRPIGTIWYLRIGRFSWFNKFSWFSRFGGFNRVAPELPHLRACRTRTRTP